MLKFTKDFASKAKYHMRAHVPLSHWLTTSKIQKKAIALVMLFLKFLWKGTHSWTTAGVESVVVSNTDGGSQQQL